jgi:hypothetical protein
VDRPAISTNLTYQSAAVGNAMLWRYMPRMAAERDDGRYSEEEIARRRDDVTSRMIKTLPQHKQSPIPKPKQRSASKGRVHKGKTRQ